MVGRLVDGPVWCMVPELVMPESIFSAYMNSIQKLLEYDGMLAADTVITYPCYKACSYYLLFAGEGAQAWYTKVRQDISWVVPSVA